MRGMQVPGREAGLGWFRDVFSLPFLWLFLNGAFFDDTIAVSSSFLFVGVSNTEPILTL